MDCPTCGRTLRVPKLDGTVEPVPDPKLDMHDADLAGALNALAMIGQGDADDDQDADEPDVSAKPVAVKVLAPQPRPIVVDAPLPAEPVVRAAEKPKPAEPAATISSMDELAALAEQARQQPAAGPAMQSRQVPGASSQSPFKNGAVVAALVIVAAAASAAGFFVGRSGRATVEVPSETNTSDDPTGSATPTKTVPVPPDRKAAVTGQITYRSADDRRPADAGARVLVFPVKRNGSATISIAGFWANADKTDFRISLAGIRELGGDAAVADKDGRYTIHLPPTDGSYHILVISSFHQRESDSRLSAGDITLLSQYFDRPEPLIKQLSYKTDHIHFNGSSPETFNHVFE